MWWNSWVLFSLWCLLDILWYLSFVCSWSWDADTEGNENADAADWWWRIFKPPWPWIIALHITMKMVSVVLKQTFTWFLGSRFIILHGFFSVSLPCIVFLSIYSFSWLKMYLVRPVTLLVILSEYCFSVQPFSFSLILITIIYSFAVYYCSVLVFGNLHLYKMPPTDCQLLEKKK